MKKQISFFVTVFALASVFSAIDAQSQRLERSVSSSSREDGPVTDCGDIRVRYDRRPAITEESEMTLAATQVSPLRVQLTNAGIYVNGWDRNDYSVKTCKAVPDDPDATAKLREIRTAANGNGQLTVSGPSSGEWRADLIIMVPRLSSMEIETANGPIQLRELAGAIRLNARNGPIKLHNIGGVVETTTTNGPISLTGASGDHRVKAVNGPISIALSGSRWEGPGLEVSTRNGPLSLSIPDAYSSGIQIGVSGSSPVSCKAAICAGAMQTPGSQKVIRIGSGDPTVRLSTENGPLSIR
jgi:DUF4097 and DUF4098 domain-containing protein YvlB